MIFDREAQKDFFSALCAARKALETAWDKTWRLASKYPELCGDEAPPLDKPITEALIAFERALVMWRAVLEENRAYRDRTGPDNLVH